MVHETTFFGGERDCRWLGVAAGLWAINDDLKHTEGLMENLHGEF
jgi:hypothetical protein